jgi:nucleoside-diphosphate-sugar epimerase
MKPTAKFVDWLTGRRGGVAITGASGWIGRAMTQMALEAMGGDVARLRLYGARARRIELSGKPLAVETLQDAAPLGDGEWLVLHLAVAGGERIAEPQALRAANEAMLAQALALAATAGQARRFVAASSGAVYQAGQGPAEKQAYSDLKRDQESVVRAWAKKTGAPLLIPRIFNVGGPYISHPQRYALGSFIQQALDGGVIEIGARRPVVRSYVHVLELARVVFDLALDEAPSLTFDTAGPEIVELADLAVAVGAALGLPDIQVRRPPLEASDEDRYVGDGALYQAALARSGAAPAGLDRIIRDTADAIRAES